MGNLSPLLLWALARLKEPSSWAGLSILLSTYGLTVAQANALVGVGVAVAAFIAVMLPEQKK